MICHYVRDARTVMNVAQDDDARRDRLRLVDTPQGTTFRVTHQPSEPVAPAKSASAEAAARYRARKRGEDVPVRKPGPKAKTATDRKQQIRDLEDQLKQVQLMREIAEGRLVRRISTLTVEQVAGELLQILKRDDPRRDTSERRVLLGDVVAEIESRHEYWPA
jgi:hypothetical protein